MTRQGPRLFLLLVLILCMPSCGGGERTLLSISITPAAADAQNFTNGMVQFTATGAFSQDPKTAPLTSGDVTWCIGSSSGTCAGFVVTGAVVDSNGLARCNAGFTGIVTVLAGKPSGIPVPADTGFPLKIYGMAALTCP